MSRLSRSGNSIQFTFFFLAFCVFSLGPLSKSFSFAAESCQKDQKDQVTLIRRAQASGLFGSKFVPDDQKKELCDSVYDVWDSSCFTKRHSLQRVQPDYMVNLAEEKDFTVQDFKIRFKDLSNDIMPRQQREFENSNTLFEEGQNIGSPRIPFLVHRCNLLNPMEDTGLTEEQIEMIRARLRELQQERGAASG